MKKHYVAFLIETQANCVSSPPHIITKIGIFKEFIRIAKKC